MPIGTGQLRRIGGGIGHIRGAFMRMGAIGQTQGEEIFPLEFGTVVFTGSIILCTPEDPFRPYHWGRLKPC